MTKPAFSRFISAACITSLIFSGCANTIPSRAKNAIAIHPTALYPVRIAVLAFVDARLEEQKEKPKKISWPEWGGRIDYYGEDVGRGLSAHIADYLTASHVFLEAQSMDFLKTDTSLKSLGYRAVLTGRVTHFNAAYVVPKWVLVLAVIPNPLFFILPGITLIPIAVWPKRVELNAVLDDLKLKDLNTGEVHTFKKIEIHDSNKDFYFHVAPKWYLGETAERATKELIGELRRANIHF